jgi:DNA-binding SARP family transcriptional activator/DNA-binding XRE family transcriptional regulator
MEAGGLIKQYRSDRGISQRRLAEAAGMSIGALQDLEQGRSRSPRWQTVDGLTTALGLSQAQQAALTSALWAQDARDRAARRPSPSIRIEILGPLAAWRDREPIALGPVRERAVLGMLALHACTSVHRDSIIDVLWGDRPPAGAIPEVQRYVSRLRKLFGDRPAKASRTHLVTTVGACYRLDAGARHLDVAKFGQLTREANIAVSRHNPQLASGLYKQALDLWRGEVLADVDLLRGYPAAVEVARCHTDAVLDYAGAAALIGADRQALPYLRELCAKEPLHEPAHARLMLALAATGHQAAALGVFAELRQRLAADLGITPSQALAHAHIQVLRQKINTPDSR